MTTVLDRTRSTRVPPVKPSSLRTAMPRPKPVSVNGVVISRAAISREAQNHPATKPIQAWLSAARALVIRELLLQEARRLGLVAAPLSDDVGRRETDDEAIIRQLIEQEISTPDADEAACRRIYENRQSSFRSEVLYAVRHILIAAPPGDAGARSEARRSADALISALTSDLAAFDDLALRYSACPSKQHGGTLGQISHGQTVPEFEAALANAPVGRIMPQPVESRYGFHVVCVDQRLDGHQLPFEAVRTAIASWLSERSRQTAIRQYIAMLAGAAKITGIVIADTGVALAE